VKIKTKSPEETERAGEEFGKKLKPGDVVLVIGELGAGKSVFIRGIAKGLKVKEIVKSPSFVIIQEFEGKYPFYHVDLYRVNTQDTNELGIFELMDKGIICIEWGERILPLLKHVKKIIVSIKKLEGNIREIEINDTSIN